MSTFYLPKFGNVDASFLGYLYDAEQDVFTVLKEASAGPTYGGVAGTAEWSYELDDSGNPDSGTIGTQTQTVDGG